MYATPKSPILQLIRNRPMVSYKCTGQSIDPTVPHKCTGQSVCQEIHNKQPNYPHHEHTGSSSMDSVLINKHLRGITFCPLNRVAIVEY